MLNLSVPTIKQEYLRKYQLPNGCVCTYIISYLVVPIKIYIHPLKALSKMFFGKFAIC
jgi:hypothetical protein